MKKYKSVFVFFVILNFSWTTNITINKQQTTNKQQTNKQKNYSIKKISLGTDFSSVVMNYENSDILYTWGNNDYGQLGLGYSDNKNVWVPTEVTSLPRGQLKNFEIDKQYSLAVLNDGTKDHLYTWGKNSSGQLGLGDNYNNIEYVDTPTEVILPIEGTIKFSDIGEEHSALLITDYSGNDHLYTWGNNNEGQLGLGDQNRRNTPTEVRNLPQGEIKKLVLSDYNTSILIEDSSGNDHLYMCGSNTEGQLGMGSTIDRWLNLQEVTSLPDGKIIDFDLGGKHSAVLIDDGEFDRLYLWGLNSSGQVGNGKSGVLKEKVTYPEQIVYVQKGQIKQIKLGKEHSSLVFKQSSNSTDTFFTWGKNDESQLGLGEDHDEDYYINEPTEVSYLPYGEIKQVSLGKNNSSVVLNIDGMDHFYIWGDNDYGQLGIGKEDEDNTKKPIEVSLFSKNPNSYVDNSFKVSEITENSFNFSFDIYKSPYDYISIPEEKIKNETYLKLNDEEFSTEFTYNEIVDSEIEKYNFSLNSDLISGNTYTDIKLCIGGIPGKIENTIEGVTIVVPQSKIRNPYVEKSFEVSEITTNSFNFSFNIYTSEEYINLSDEDIRTKTYLKLNDDEFNVVYKYKESINSEIDKYNFSLTSDLIEGKTYNNIKLHIGGTSQSLEISITDIIINIPFEKNPNPYVLNSFEVSEITSNSFTFSFKIYTSEHYISLPELEIETQTYLELNGGRFQANFLNASLEPSNYNEVKYNFIIEELKPFTLYSNIKLHIGGTSENTKNIIQEKVRTKFTKKFLFYSAVSIVVLLLIIILIIIIIVRKKRNSNKNVYNII